MTMTDPIADMLTRIRNANSAQFETVSMPGSKMKQALAAILQQEGYITGYEVLDQPGKTGSTLEITMKYARADRIPRVLGGIGVAVVSTSRGLMTDREARNRHLGGEVLCYVW
jgi:small subunit ribosomal protein S8